MKIKSGVWYWLAVASGAVGLLYGMGLDRKRSSAAPEGSSPPLWRLC